MHTEDININTRYFIRLRDLNVVSSCRKSEPGITEHFVMFNAVMLLLCFMSIFTMRHKL